MNQMPTSVLATAGPGGQGPEWRRVPMPTLFLRLQINRDHTVQREPSFAYPVLTDYFPVGNPLPFQLELLNEKGVSLSCSRLREDCWHCDAFCWPKRVRQAVSYPDGARKLRILHGADTIYEEDIPDPPAVKVDCSYDSQTNRIRIRWSATAPADTSSEGGGEGANLWYLVHYHSRGAWRGLGPRTQQREAWLNVKQLAVPATTPVRVLATSGIATGIAECVPKTKGPAPPPEGRLIDTGGDPSEEGPVPLTHPLRVHAIDDGGRLLVGADIRWYDESGRELARGRDFDVGRLGVGQHVITAVATQTGGRPIGRTFVIGRPEPGGPCQLHAAHDMPRREDSPAHIHRDKRGGHGN